MTQPTLRHVIVPRAALDVSARARMLELMQLCYDNVAPERFYADLDKKDHVITLVTPDGALRGFSTIRIAEETLEGKPVDILFSGDTVIHPDSWGTKALQRGFLAFTLGRKLKNPRRGLYWLLLSKGYKTYLLLTNNFPSAFPRREYEAPAALRALRDKVALAWWGAEYDPATEILRYAVPQDRVKAGVAAVEADTQARPDVAFFLARNPRWSEGEELVCFAEIDFGLPFRFTFKQLKRMLSLRSVSSPARSPTS